MERRTEAHEGREPEGSHGQEPPRGAGEEEDGVDPIGRLPNDVLGHIISSLPTKDAARTQILARTWSHLWLSAPLNIDCSGGVLHGNEEVEANLVSSLLAANPGPARRLSIPVFHLHHRPLRVDAWLRSPALNSLQELQFIPKPYYYHLEMPQMPLPVSALRFSATLRVATFSHCYFPENAIDELRFPQLRQLGLQGVKISEASLHSIISGSPVLECLLLSHSYGFGSIRINSPSLVSIGLYRGNFIIEDAPLLERLIQLVFGLHTHVSVISAPKLETLGCLSSRINGSTYTFGTTILQELKVNSVTTELNKSGDKNFWRRKYKGDKCPDIRLKTLVLADYKGTKSQLNFAQFFVWKAKRLVLMRIEGHFNDDFKKEQQKSLKFEKRASTCAELVFTSSTCEYYPYFPHIKHVGDLSKTNPFECVSPCVRSNV